MSQQPPLLMDELSQSERVVLNNMIQHAGYRIVRKLMESACTRINERHIRIDPMDSDYEIKLRNSHIAARVANEFCASLIKSIEWHSSVAMQEDEAERLRLAAQEE